MNILPSFQASVGTSFPFTMTYYSSIPPKKQLDSPVPVRLAFPTIIEETQPLSPSLRLLRSGKNLAILTAMHGIFNTLLEGGKPWLKTVVHEIGSPNPPKIAQTYLEGVDLIKNASNLYVGDLHGSWLKLLLKMAQFEGIQMPEVQATEFLSIYHAFEALIKADEQRILARNQSRINHFKAKLQQQGIEAEKVAGKVTGYKNKLINIEQFTCPKTKQATHYLVNKFKKALEKVDWIGGEDKMIHLMGDVLADRGPLDLFTLLLIEKFKNNINIVLSNHDMGAVQLLLGYLSDKPAASKYKDLSVELASQTVSGSRLLCSPNCKEGFPPQGRLLGGLSEIENPAFSEQGVIDLYKTYLSRLKLAAFNPKDNAFMFHCHLKDAAWQQLVAHLVPSSPLLNSQNPKKMSMRAEQVASAFEVLNLAFQKQITAELENPTTPKGSESFQKLLNHLYDEIWDHSFSGRANNFDYTKAVKLPHISHYMLGHHCYKGGSRVDKGADARFYQLDNKAFSYGKLGEESPVVISYNKRY